MILGQKIFTEAIMPDMVEMVKVSVYTELPYSFFALTSCVTYTIDYS